MALARRHSFKFDLDIGKASEKKTVDVVFFRDLFGRVRLLADAELPKEARKFKGTLLHALLSTNDFELVRTKQGFRLKDKEGNILEYEFTLTTKDGRSGIPYSIDLFTRIRNYIDLRNVKLSGRLDGAVVSVKINSVNCDLKDSSVKEIKRVYKAFRIYNLDGSQTLVYKPEKIQKRIWPVQLGLEYGRLPAQRAWFLPIKFTPQPKAPGLTDLGHFSQFQPDSDLARGWQIGEEPSQPESREAPSLGAFAPGGFDVLADGMPENYPALKAAQESHADIRIVSTASKNRGFAQGAGAHLDLSRAVFSSPEPKAERGKPIAPIPLSRIKKFKAVIFDLDGVVVDSERAHLVTFNRTFAPLGAKISESRWRRHYTGIGSVAIVEDLFRRNGITADVRGWVGKRAAVYQKHVQKHGLPTIAGFREFHSLLRKNGIKVAVGSGGHKPHVAASLKSIGRSEIPFIGLEDVKNSKPAPDTFLRAASLIGVQPEECIVVEDSLSGLRAAAAAGMPAIALTTTLPRRELAGKAALIVPNFKSTRLKRAIRKLIKTKGLAKKNNGKQKAARKRRA